MPSPQLSILFSVYKEPVSDISVAVQSIIDQTFGDFELIMVLDDPRNTEALRYLHELRAADPRVVVIENDHNVGLGTALNKAVAIARGLYCARMDTEDVSLPTRLEKQLAYMQSNPEVDLLFTQWTEQLADGTTRERTPAAADVREIEKNFFVKSILLHPTLMAKTSILKQNPYPAISRPEDFILFMDLIKRSFKFDLIEEVLYVYQVDLSQKYQKVRTYSENLLPVLFVRIPNFWSNVYFWLYFARITFEYIISRNERVYHWSSEVSARLWRKIFR